MNTLAFISNLLKRDEKSKEFLITTKLKAFLT